MKKPKMHFWAVVNRLGNIVVWQCSDGERGVEIHYTKREAQAACFKQDGEKVKKVKVILG